MVVTRPRVAMTGLTFLALIRFLNDTYGVGVVLITVAYVIASLVTCLALPHLGFPLPFVLNSIR